MTGVRRVEEQTVGVIVCAYTMDRWPDIVVAAEGIARQSRRPNEVVLVIDHNEALLVRAQADLPAIIPEVRVLANAGERGLSGARNTAIEATTSSLLAFLDDDAAPQPEWLLELLAPFDDPAVLATGGRAIAAWPTSRPRWFAAEFDWVVGSCYVGMPTTTSVVRNVIGCSMAFRAEVFKLVGTFTEGIGRVGRIPLGCEETELCIRITQADPAAQIIYAPASIVHHRVSDDRIRFGYFRRRCMAEGRSKAAIGALIGHADGTSSERSYAARTLPAAVLRSLREAASGDPAGSMRAAAIVCGFALTAIGYLGARVSAFARSERAPGARIVPQR
jgi:O-antigen biosynthesis protein